MNTLLYLGVFIALVFAIILSRNLYLKRLQTRQRLKMSRIFTNITHELLTPLTVISASVDHLRDEAPRHTRDYDLMQLNIQRMVRLLQQILETSKSQEGELKLLVSNGDVMKYIHDTALCLEPLMGKKNMHFNIKCQPESMMGWIDTDKLDKIIYNLLSNAAKYTGDNGEVELSVNTNVNYDHIIIKVRDTGSGISKEQQKHLFQRFYDGEYRQHRTIGHGLGLSLVRDLVYLNRGTIDCHSVEGEGTVFTVTLPINRESFSPEQIDEENKFDVNQPTTAITDFNTMVPDFNSLAEEEESMSKDAYRVLIVEDNLELLMLMQHLLKTSYRIFVAKNGAEALDIVHKHNIDLIVSDVMMPEMDGLELTKAIKSDPDFNHLPIILLTAKTQEEDQQEGLRLGADEFLTKPFRLGDLRLRIDNIIENRKRVQQEPREQNLVTPAGDMLTPPDQLFLQQATNCVLENIANSSYDRDAFANDMGASQSTLYNKLRSVTGMNVSTFIRNIRLKEAEKMIKQNPKLRVSDLAYAVGFQDPKYFSSCFKKEYGILPKEYMEKLKEAS